MLYKERVAVPTLTWYGESHPTRVHIMHALLNTAPKPSFWTRLRQWLRVDLAWWTRHASWRARAAA